MNTLLIAHRINSSKELAQIPKDSGIEVDLRDSEKGLILSHDPFSDGELFENFIQNYEHKKIILNIKSERIEYKVLEILEKYQINDYFFLDSSFPMIIDLSKKGIKNIAARISEFESIGSINLISERVNWIWLDSFNSFYLSKKEVKEIKELNLKTCLVSPELQGREHEIESYSTKMKSLGLKVDAICTKFPNFSRWIDYINS